MAVFHFKGRVLPDHLPLTVEYSPKFKRDPLIEDEPPSILEVLIREGSFQVSVHVQSYTDQVALSLFQAAWDSAQRLANAAGFIRAIPYKIIIDFIERPDGSLKAIALGDSHLRSLSSFTESDIEKIADLMIADHALGETMADLLMMLGRTHYAPISYGRVAESIARMAAPGEEKSSAMWARARKELRVSEQFFRSLTSISTDPRHGNRKPVSAIENRRLSQMAWLLANRYIHYRLSNGVLSTEEFPEL